MDVGGWETSEEEASRLVTMRADTGRTIFDASESEKRHAADIIKRTKVIAGVALLQPPG